MPILLRRLGQEGGLGRLDIDKNGGAVIEGEGDGDWDGGESLGIFNFESLI